MNIMTEPVLSIARLNRKLFVNSMEGITEEGAYKQLNENTNSVIFLAAHLLDARYYMLNFCGSKIECPWKEQFGDVKKSSDIRGFPSLKEIIFDWEKVSDIFEDYIPSLDEELLRSKPPFDFPVVDESIIGGLSFLIEHEAYHIGQIGLIRRFMGLPAVKYD